MSDNNSIESQEHMLDNLIKILATGEQQAKEIINAAPELERPLLRAFMSSLMISSNLALHIQVLLANHNRLKSDVKELALTLLKSNNVDRTAAIEALMKKIEAHDKDLGELDKYKRDLEWVHKFFDRESKNTEKQ